MMCTFNSSVYIVHCSIPLQLTSYFRLCYTHVLIHHSIEFTFECLHFYYMFNHIDKAKRQRNTRSGGVVHKQRHICACDINNWPHHMNARNR